MKLYILTFVTLLLYIQVSLFMNCKGRFNYFLKIIILRLQSSQCTLPYKVQSQSCRNIRNSIATTERYLDTKIRRLRSRIENLKETAINHAKHYLPSLMNKTVSDTNKKQSIIQKKYLIFSKKVKFHWNMSLTTHVKKGYFKIAQISLKYYLRCLNN